MENQTWLWEKKVRTVLGLCYFSTLLASDWFFSLQIPLLNSCCSCHLRTVEWSVWLMSVGISRGLTVFSTYDRQHQILSVAAAYVFSTLQYLRGDAQRIRSNWESKWLSIDEWMSNLIKVFLSFKMLFFLLFLLTHHT